MFTLMIPCVLTRINFFTNVAMYHLPLLQRSSKIMETQTWFVICKVKDLFSKRDRYNSRIFWIFG